MASVYLQKLLSENRDVGERYQMNLQLINNLDPFTLNFGDLDYSFSGIPPVTNMDIVAYLVLTHSYYTKDQMKAFKSLQAYKYFEAGFVQKVGSKLVEDFYVLLGKVKHSQRANMKPLDVWVIVAKDGSISTAHCTCMAGNSEVCSHVGAILFAAEYANKIKEARSCTDVKAMWPMPSLSTSVPIVPVKEMDWGKPSAVYEEKTIPAMSSTEIVNMLKNVENLGYSSALMRIVEPFATKISEEMNKTLPSVLDIFHEDNLTKSYSQLMTISRTVNLALTQEDIHTIDKAMQKQAQNENWYLLRAGRITASKFKAVCRTSKSTIIVVNKV